MHACTCRDQALDLLGALEDDLVSLGPVVSLTIQSEGVLRSRWCWPCKSHA